VHRGGAGQEGFNVKRWIIAGVVTVLVIVVGGPFVYFHFIEGKTPAKLSIANAPTSTLKPGTTRAPLAGTWKIGSGSLVRYRVKETLFGQSHTAVGGTSSVTGSLQIAGTKVTTASFRVDMTTFTSTGASHDIRDGQFQNRIMDTADFPTATFTLTSPIDLGTPPADGVVKTYPATGKLTMHGTTKTVTITLTGRRTANVITVVGSTPITFSDYNIDNPSGGPASVGNSGTLEFQLNLTPH
jgi:polyisoprenoid-binding protein YceI